MQWQKKLYQHEEIPPPGIWEEMIKVLAEEPYQLRQSLNEYSVTPPSNIWENIHAKIGNSLMPVSEPLLYKIRRSALSYAAAIIGIGLFTTLIVFLLNNKPNEVGVKDLAAGLNFQDSPLVENSKDTNLDIQKNQAINKPTPGSPITENDPEKSDSKNKDGQASDHVPVNDTQEISAFKKPSVGVAKKTIQQSSSQYKSSQKVSYSDGNYILLYENDGQSKRVSYKLADMVESLHNIDQSGNAKNASQQWSRKISAWKEKMGHSTFIPSASNFFDIAEMAEMLKTDK
jgi:hypothetical protein